MSHFTDLHSTKFSSQLWAYFGPEKGLQILQYLRAVHGLAKCAKHVRTSSAVVAVVAGAPVAAEAVAAREAQARVAPHSAAVQQLLHVGGEHLAAALEPGGVRAAPIQGVPDRKKKAKKGGWKDARNARKFEFKKKTSTGTC